MDRSGGDYTLKDMQWTVIEPTEWGSRRVIPPDEAAGTESGVRPANVYQGAIQMPENGWFVTSYPWREGYEIRVDGVSVLPQKINMAFMGFPISAGNHEIAIAYTAPGYSAGLLGTVLGVIAFALLLLWENRKTAIAAACEIREKSRKYIEGEDSDDGNGHGKKENQRDRAMLQ